MSQSDPIISIIIPFYNEVENVDFVLDEVRRTNPAAEIIAVDDGSSDGTAHKLMQHQDVQAICLPRNLGQSAALYIGLAHAAGELCVMMDGDGQNDPADIPFLIAQKDQADVICGYRKKRQDSFYRRMASRIANVIRGALLHDHIRDTGCTLKVIRREHVKYLVPFQSMHRFIPALLCGAGLSIAEYPVNHRARKAGESKYTIGGRAIRGLYDLIGVCWLRRRQIHWPIDMKLQKKSS